MKKIVALLSVFTLILFVFPFSAFAAEEYDFVNAEVLSSYEAYADNYGDYWGVRAGYYPPAFEGGNFVRINVGEQAYHFKGEFIYDPDNDTYDFFADGLYLSFYEYSPGQYELYCEVDEKYVSKFDDEVGLFNFEILLVPVIPPPTTYNVIDITDYISGREVEGDNIIVNYDVPIPSWSLIQGTPYGTPGSVDIAEGQYVRFEQLPNRDHRVEEVYYDGTRGFLAMGANYPKYGTLWYDASLLVNVTNVWWDGEEYDVVPLIDGDTIIIGNPSILGTLGPADAVDNGLPFCISNLSVSGVSTSVQCFVPFNTNYNETHSIKVAHIWDTYLTAQYDYMTFLVYPMGKQNTSWNVIDISDIKSGSQFDLSFWFHVDIEHIGDVDYGTSMGQFQIIYLDKNYDVLTRNMADLNYAGLSQIVGDLEYFEFSHSFTVPDGAEYFYLFADVERLSVEECSMYDFRMTELSFSCALSSIENNTQTMDKVQDKLNEIDGKLDNIGDKIEDTNNKLDDIIGYEPTPDEPPGSDIIQDTDDIEHDLIDDAIGNLDQLEDVKLSAMEAILLYAGGFACVSTIIDLFARLPFFTGLLYVSLSLGIVSSLLSIANTISSRSGKSHAGKE